MSKEGGVDTVGLGSLGLWVRISGPLPYRLWGEMNVNSTASVRTSCEGQEVSLAPKWALNTS